MTKFKAHPCNKKGIAFLTTIILLGLVVIASAALSVIILRDAFNVKRLKASSEAYYLAEAGIEEGIEKLWSNSFSTTGFPFSRTNMGNGTINVSLDTSKWSSDNILLINSIGTVNGISRIIRTEVKANLATSVDYAILADSNIELKDLSIINAGSGSGVHSNKNNSSAVEVGGESLAAVVNGDASAVGTVEVKTSGTVTGNITNGASAVSLPAFDATYFNYYYNLANASGDVYSSNTTFNNVNLAPANGVIYVNGNVKIEGNVTLTGCIIATGKIEEENGIFNQTQFADFPALMSINDEIEIENQAVLNGLVYAKEKIEAKSENGNPGDIVINGVLLSKNGVELKYTTVNYVPQAMSAPGQNPLGWILNWNE